MDTLYPGTRRHSTWGAAHVQEYPTKLHGCQCARKGDKMGDKMAINIACGKQSRGLGRMDYDADRPLDPISD
jgi:hypothetical protein